MTSKETQSEIQGAPPCSGPNRTHAYLVGWFLCEGWDGGTDLRKSRTPKVGVGERPADGAVPAVMREHDAAAGLVRVLRVAQLARACKRLARIARADPVAREVLRKGKTRAVRPPLQQLLGRHPLPTRRLLDGPPDPFRVDAP
jgi:hypothetical protein